MHFCVSGGDFAITVIFIKLIYIFETYTTACSFAAIKYDVFSLKEMVIFFFYSAVHAFRKR